MPAASKTQYAILGALSIQPMSGYQIKKMMANSTNYFWTESNGQLYPTLAKLSSAKLVKCKEEKVGEKLRKIYFITAAGKKLLQQWLLEDPNYYPMRNELLLKIFYGSNVSPDVSIKHIEKHAEKCKQLLNIYSDIESNLECMVRNKERPVYFLLTVKAGIGMVKANLQWCEESIKLINKYK